MKKDVKELLSSAREEKQRREEWRLRLALLKESRAYRAFWDELGHRGQDLTGDELAEFNGILREKFGIALDPFRRPEWFDRLNPYKQNDAAIVRFDYPRPAISLVMGKGTPEEHRHRTTTRELKPSERLLKVDLSRKRSDLLREFTLFLDLVEAYRDGGDVPEDWKLNYATWQQDNSRFRSEAWQALAVWRLRRKRKTYSEIARTLKISLPAAKKAFWRAYELIEGKRHDSEKFKREKLPLVTADVKGGCGDCSIRRTCKELCPDMLAFVSQDHGATGPLPVDATDFYGPQDEENEENEDILIEMIDAKRRQ